MRSYVTVGEAHPTRIGDHSLFNQHLHDLFHEKRVAFGFFQDELP